MKRAGVKRRTEGYASRNDDGLLEQTGVPARAERP